MKFQLVIQFDTSNFDDFDWLIALEDKLELKLGSAHEVDGHDFGSGEMNIFINTNNPQSALATCKKAIDELTILKFIAAYRDFTSEEFTVIYPKNKERVFSVI
ncbi:hypothetical protein WNY51_11750 [Pseudocolwellia sp. AS88]|uniref:hypothetical protein n=1 Tax=Pseudocolwellia sp. AS88 TaxID=3063958 RepID=UPI0026EB9294|nr:hypothetical protein [Pseudocolwellia sp. AS88]MDO7084224.1 hypothetical protein [Pseudocolwellia sp. AS88]